MRRRTLGCVVAVMIAGGCGEDTTQPEGETRLAVQSGDNQTQTVGQALASPVVVRVSRDGTALPGATVSWAVTAGGGSVTPATTTTDADGLASATWTLGPSVGANTLEASVSGATGSPVSFSATGESGMAPSSASVGVEDSFFDPSSVTIAQGGDVTWTWNGGLTHNVTFSTGTNSGDRSSGTFTRVFAEAGSFDYMCTIHGAAMTGTVVVQ